MTYLPFASMTLSASACLAKSAPMAEIFSPTMPTSAFIVSEAVTTVPPLISVSNLMVGASSRKDSTQGGCNQPVMLSTAQVGVKAEQEQNL